MLLPERVDILFWGTFSKNISCCEPERLGITPIVEVLPVVKDSIAWSSADLD